jgi:proteasome accessory factor C
MSTLAAERLKRLLFLVPFVSKHPGRTVDEVAAAVGCSKKELLEELDLVTLIGHPPFQPDDFVDLYVEDDKVYVQFDQRLSAPPRLTAAEGVALATAAALLKPEPGSALAAALQKLERVLPSDAAARFKELKTRLDVQTQGADGIAPLTQAVVAHHEVEFDYVGVARGEPARDAVVVGAAAAAVASVVSLLLERKEGSERRGLRAGAGEARPRACDGQFGGAEAVRNRLAFGAPTG